MRRSSHSSKRCHPRLSTKNEFIVSDLTRSEDDPLAIRLRFDTPLDLQKEIELRQKKKIKSKPADT